MRREDDGFTLVELLVVVLVLAILLAIALPTFLGAREQAADRAAQSNLRNAHTTAFVYYVGKRQEFTDHSATLGAIDPSLRFVEVPSDLQVGPFVFVEVPPAGTRRPMDTIFLGSRSGSGRCYWIRSVGDENHPRFAVDDCTPDPSAIDLGLTFTERW